MGGEGWGFTINTAITKGEGGVATSPSQMYHGESKGLFVLKLPTRHIGHNEITCTCTKLQKNYLPFKVEGYFEALLGVAEIMDDWTSGKSNLCSLGQIKVSR